MAGRLLPVRSGDEASIWIGGREQKTFQLTDHVQVGSAELNEGLLQITLQRVIPEALKPRTIAIRSAIEQKTIAAKRIA